MKKKAVKRNEFLINMFKSEIINSGLNDLYATHANNLLFFLNEEKHAAAVRKMNIIDPLMPFPL